MPSVSHSRVKIFSVDRDDVVKALVATGRVDYRFALEKFVPLINRLEIQRKIQNPRFYERLKRDLLKGCLMPPITLAFVRRTFSDLNNEKNFQAFVEQNIGKAFVLDGIQRLSTLQRASDEHPTELKLSKPLFINVLVCKSMDNLLYRMITLNNGQRPMTTRHQIEILSANMFDISNGDITLSTERGGKRKVRGVFAQSDIILGYMAFLSSSTTVDSQKLIEEKLDELVASKILENDPTTDTVEFSEVTRLIGRFCENPKLDKWFKITNNLIGFCAGAKQGFATVKKLSDEEFLTFLGSVEEAVQAFDVSKIKLGRVRRNAIAYCVRYAATLVNASPSLITEKIVELIEP